MEKGKSRQLLGELPTVFDGGLIDYRLKVPSHLEQLKMTLEAL